MNLRSIAGPKTKHDFRGFYTRPSADGSVAVVGPLPLRRHEDWTSKGYEFIALSRIEELIEVQGHATADEYAIYDEETGAFDVSAYLKSAPRRVHEGGDAA